METNLWARFRNFVWNSLTQKFKAFMPGMCMGFIGSQHFLWIGVPITLVEYIGKFIGTVFLAFGSGLATSYGSYIIEKHKNKNNEGPKSQKKRNTDKAA